MRRRDVLGEKPQALLALVVQSQIHLPPGLVLLRRLVFEVPLTVTLPQLVRILREPLWEEPSTKNVTSLSRLTTHDKDRMWAASVLSLIFGKTERNLCPHAQHDGKHAVWVQVWRSQVSKNKCLLLPGCSAQCDTAALVCIAPARVPGSQTALRPLQRWLEKHKCVKQACSHTGSWHQTCDPLGFLFISFHYVLPCQSTLWAL